MAALELACALACPPHLTASPAPAAALHDMLVAQYSHG